MNMSIFVMSAVSCRQIHRGPSGSEQTTMPESGNTVCHSSRSRLLISNFIPYAAASSTFKSGDLLSVTPGALAPS
jgi:hypothetical protein